MWKYLQSKLKSFAGIAGNLHVSVHVGKNNKYVMSEALLCWVLPFFQTALDILRKLITVLSVNIKQHSVIGREQIQ
jgi:hypothetical protein